MSLYGPIEKLQKCMKNKCASTQGKYAKGLSSAVSTYLQKCSSKKSKTAIKKCNDVEFKKFKASPLAKEYEQCKIDKCGKYAKQSNIAAKKVVKAIKSQLRSYKRKRKSNTSK
jgi:hypothetical protein